MSEKAVIYGCWLVLAVTLIFFSVSFMRINLGIYHIPIPAFFVLILMGMTALKCHSFLTEFKELNHYRLLIILTGFILITHGISMIRGYPSENALKEFVKISSGLLTFWFVVIFFPKNPKFLKLFLKIASAGTIIILSALLYYYGIHLKAPYLGTLYAGEITPDGKSHLAWLLTVLAPYCLNSLFERGISFFWLIANTIIGLSIIYAMSRASWIAMFFAICFLSFFAFRDHLRPNLKMLALFAVTMALLLGLFINHVHLGETLALRSQSIYAPASMPETPSSTRLGKYSIRNRSMLLSRAFSKFKEAPWFGIGLAASPYENGEYDSEVVTHNDYACLLTETGLLGTIPLIAFLVLFARQLFLCRSRNQNRTFLLRAAQASFFSILILSCFINSYTSVHYWFFLAMALKTKQIYEVST